VRANDPWVTENKLIAGMTETVPAPAPEAEPSEAPRSENWDPLDTIYLPLYGLDRSRLIGIISMDSPLDGKAPTESGMRPIELFAAQAASAIENTRLYQGMINAAQQEARINEVTEAITSTLQLDKIIQSVASGFQQTIAFTRMSVGLLSENRRQFEVLRVVIDVHGEVTVEPGEPIPVVDSAMGLAASEALSKIYDLSYPDEASDFVDLKAWRENGERTSLVVPMVAAGHVVGALHMGSELADAFGFEAQLPLVSRVANLTAVAIENAQLLQETLGLQAFNESVIQSIQQGIIVVDRDRRIRTVNAFMRRV
jgi:GAF domain-containing protein